MEDYTLARTELAYALQRYQRAQDEYSAATRLGFSNNVLGLRRYHLALSRLHDARDYLEKVRKTAELEWKS